MSEDETADWYADMVARQQEGLVVGARVRITLSGECPCPAVEGSLFQQRGQGVHGDFSFHGQVGFVHRIYDNSGFYGSRGHRYEVVIPRDEIDVQRRDGVHLHHAAQELEPLPGGHAGGTEGGVGMDDMTPDQQRLLSAARRLIDQEGFVCREPRGDATPIPTCAGCSRSGWGEINHDPDCTVQELISAVRALSAGAGR